MQRGEPEPSSHSVANISELAVPGFDHAPYKVGGPVLGWAEGERHSGDAGRGQGWRAAMPLRSGGSGPCRMRGIHLQAGSEHAKVAVCVGMREGGAPACSGLPAGQLCAVQTCVCASAPHCSSHLLLHALPCAKDDSQLPLETPCCAALPPCRAADHPPRPLVLVGDCNNTVPSHKRGGGGVVVEHPHLWELLRLMAVQWGAP